MTITAAVDGSSLGNPGPAGWAWVVSPTVWEAGGWPQGTNNLGELTAVLQLLRATEAAGLADQRLRILSDSQYVINGLTKWMPGWKRRGWKKADGKPVANRTVFEALDQALLGRSVKFEWVKGHAGHVLNEAADSKARAAAEAYQVGRTVSTGPGFGAAEGEVEGPDSQAGQADQTDLPAVFTMEEAAEKWSDIAALADGQPVTITRQDHPTLVVLNAQLAKEALSALNGATKRSEADLDEPQVLF